jgi:hypothetical protein
MNRTRFVLAAVALLVGVVAVTGGAAVLAGTPQPVWNEVPWPFPMDQWGKGKAFACKAADCGSEVTVYLRAKIGFCNCTTGVADDDELDRISDFTLFENKLHALSAGKPIAVAWMKGRSRAFAVLDNPRAAKSALSVGFNDRCDAIIATALVVDERPETVEQAVLDFLNSQTVLRWAEVTLGL